MKRDWDKLRRQDKARPANPIDSFRPKYSRKFLAKIAARRNKNFV